MTNHAKTIPSFLGLLALILYVTSLGLPAAYQHGFGAPTSGIPGNVLRGYEMLFGLPFAMLAPSWWSNPLWIVGLLALRRNRLKIACACAILATALAALVLWIGPFPPDPFKFSHLHAGYYVWLASHFLLLAATLFSLNAKQSIQPTKHD